MRKATWLAALITLAALVLPALAQQPAGQPDAKSFFTGVDPRKLNMTKVDTAKAMRKSNLQQTLQPTSAARSTSVFSLSNVFPRVTLGTWPPRLPTFAAVKTPPMPKSTTVPAGSVNMFNNPPPGSVSLFNNAIKK